MAKPLGYDLSAAKRIDGFHNSEVRVRTVVLGFVAVSLAAVLKDITFIWWFVGYEILFCSYAFLLQRSPRWVGLERYLLVVVLGMALIAGAALWGHGQWSGWAESGVTLLGSLVLVSAHWINFQEVRRVHVHVHH